MSSSGIGLARTEARRGAGRTAPSTGVLARRIRLFRVLLVVGVVAIGARLIDVQVFESAGYQRAASEELTQVVTLPALRGGIYARNGAVLAMSITTDTVIADDFQVRHPLAEADALSPLLGVAAPRLYPLLTEHSGYVPLAHQVSQSRAAKVAADGFTGITLIDGSERVAPGSGLASPVVGTVHASGTGASGIEYQYNKELSGTPGRETLLESPSGITLPGAATDKKAARPGTGIELTLDEPLQYVTEQALAKEVVASRAVSGIAEVMDVRTGDILAMANLANNTPQAGTRPATENAAITAPDTGNVVTIGPSGPVSEASSNLAVTQSYEPGSVFKVVTFSAALQDGVITPTTTFMVADQEMLDGSYFHDAESHPTEPMTATEIIAQSSNIGTSEIAEKLGETRLLAQVHKLGFGTRTTLDFPGSANGVIAGPTQWEPTNYVSLPIGQVDAVTAQQVLDAYNAVANGGVFVEPRLVQATVEPDGTTVAAAPSAAHRVIPAVDDAELTTMLEQVVKSGTGTYAFIPGYSVAGKTGTSQIPTPGAAGYIPGAYMATFVGFAPAAHPVLAAIVVLDRSNPIYGGTAAAPVFSKVMSYALHRYDIPTTPGAPTTPPAAGTVASAVTLS